MRDTVELSQSQSGIQFVRWCLGHSRVNSLMQQNISTNQMWEVPRDEESVGSASSGMVGIEKTRIILPGRELAEKRRQGLVLL